MRNLATHEFISSKHEPQPAPTSSLEIRTTALKNFYAALDQVLFLIESPAGERPNLRHPIDFYDEVKSFEIKLIRQALKKSGGSQLRAAALLGLKASTLNAKVKSYQINCKNYSMQSGDRSGWSEAVER
ncbi:MAG TPA: helix-turn-helix domain-containing protein [Pyrinomonadaceae bacterium]|nr:helix-turn-helix domain-containing protein [Pyrinomonadaceae bacterium]